MDSTIYYYVYQLTDIANTALYIGSRKSAGVPPSDDFGRRYFTSGVLRDAFKTQPNNFTWVILSTHETHDAALEEEQRQIHAAWDDPRCQNHYAYPTQFRLTESWYAAVTESNRRKAKDPEWLRRNALQRQAMYGPEHNKKITEGKKREWAERIKRDPEAHRQRYIERNRAIAQDPKWKEKQHELNQTRRRECSTRLWQDPEHKRKVAEKIKRRWQDPEYKARVGAAIASAKQQQREAIAEKMKQLWQDPEYRRRVLASRKQPRPKRAGRQPL